MYQFTSLFCIGIFQSTCLHFYFYWSPLAIHHVLRSNNVINKMHTIYRYPFKILFSEMILDLLVDLYCICACCNLSPDEGVCVMKHYMFDVVIHVLTFIRNFIIFAKEKYRKIQNEISHTTYTYFFGGEEVAEKKEHRIIAYLDVSPERLGLHCNRYFYRYFYALPYHDLCCR